MSNNLQTKPKIKICGITNLGDAIYCSNLGASYLGIIFVPNTKRHIQNLEELAIEIKKNCPNPKLVLVTKLEYLKELESVLKLFDIVQIHDKYDKKTVQKLKTLDLEIWQLFDYKKSITDSNISQFVVDKPKNTQMTQSEYLTILQKTKLPINFVLAGQISTDNLAEFIKLKPPIIDICSSVESHFGTKSKLKLTQFFQEISQMTN